MPPIDVSVIVTLHRERAYLARTFASLLEATAFAQASGIAVELVAVLDRVDPPTRALLQDMDLSGFDATQCIDVDHGSPGLARNAGRVRARGTYILHVDGDDLISYSMLTHMFRAAQRLGPEAILVPKFSFFFGITYHVVEYFSQHAIASIAITDQHPYTVVIFYHRSLVNRVHYPDIPAASSNHAYEDWHFNASAMALGYVFHAVEHTALFYRQRPDSISRRSWHHSTRQIPPAALFQPLSFLRCFASEARRLTGRKADVFPQATGKTVLLEPVYRDLLAHANAIDPMVEISCYLPESVTWSTNAFAPDVGLAYYRACEVVGDNRFDAVFLLPGRLPDDDVDAVAIAMRKLAATSPNDRILALIGEALPMRDEAELLVASTVQLDLSLLCGHLKPEECDIICLKLLQSCAAGASLHCAPSPFARRFLSRFGVLLTGNPITCYRRPDRNRRAHGLRFVDPTAFGFISDHHDMLDRIVVYDQDTLDADRRRLPGLHHKWRLMESATA